MKYFYTIISTLIILAILIFIFQNTDLVILKFFTFKTIVLSGIMILTSVFLGIILTATFFFPIVAIKSRKIKDLDRQIVFLKDKIRNETIQYESDGLGSEGMDYKEKKNI